MNSTTLLRGSFFMKYFRSLQRGVCGTHVWNAWIYSHLFPYIILCKYIIRVAFLSPCLSNNRTACLEATHTHTNIKTHVNNMSEATEALSNTKYNEELQLITACFIISNFQLPGVASARLQIHVARSSYLLFLCVIYVCHLLLEFYFFSSEIHKKVAVLCHIHYLICQYYSRR